MIKIAKHSPVQFAYKTIDNRAWCGELMCWYLQRLVTGLLGWAGEIRRGEGGAVSEFIEL